MKSLALVLLGIAIAVGAFVIYERQNSEKPQPVAAPIVDQQTAPEQMPQPEVEEVEPMEIPEAPAPAVDFEARAAEPFTVLTDKQGREIQAKILSVISDQIKLRRNDGLETSIPISMLSEADIAFCEYMRENIPQVTEIPTPSKTTPQGSLEPKVLEAQGGIDWDAIFGETF